MDYQPNEYEETVLSARPQRTAGNRRWIIWVGVGTVALCLTTVCLVGAFFLVQRFQSRVGGAAAPPLVIPTVPPTPAETMTAATSPSLAPTVTLPSETRVAAPPAGPGNVEAVQLSAPPAIDGNLSEWPGTAVYESAFRVYSDSEWDGSEDLTAVWQLAWDSDNLYIGVTVTDDTHVQTQTGNQIFRGDSLDMQFDTDRTGDYAARVSPDDFQITLSPGDFAALPPAAFRFQGTTDNRLIDAPGGHQVTVAAQKTEGGYDLEAAIPWQDLDLTPESELVIGVALNANDNDRPGTAVQEVMMSHVSTRTLRDPTGWGTLTLKNNE